MNIDIKNGTPHFGKSSACLSCKFSTVRESRQGDIRIKCSQFDTFIREHVVTCNAYYNKNEPWMHEYESIAWVMTTDVHGRKIGFRKIRNDEPSVPVGF